MPESDGHARPSRSADAIRLLARADSRRHRWSLVLLGITTAMVLGAVLAAAAGAHRTSTVFDRFLDETNASDVMIGVSWPALADDDEAIAEIVGELESLDGVESVQARGIIPIFAGTRFDMIASTPYGATPTTPATDRPVVVAGRLPREDAPREVAVNEIAARELDLGVGDVLTAATMATETADLWFRGELSEAETDFILDGPELTLDVVGIVRGTADLSPSGSENPMAITSPAFLPAHREAARFTALFTLGADVDRLDFAEAIAGLERLVPGNTEVYGGPQDAEEDATRLAFDAIATGLVVFAAVGLVVGLIVLWIMMSRHLQLGRADREAATALGATRPELTVSAAVPVAVSITVGTAAGVALAFATSPVFPYSVARRAEVSPGLRFDPLVHIGLAVAVWAVLMVAAVTSARMGTTRERSPRTNRSPRFATIRSRLSPPVADGCSTVLATTGRRGIVRPWTAIAGATIGVAGIVGIGTVVTTQHSAANDSERFGEMWDLQPDLGSGSEPLPIADGLAEDPRVDAVGGIFCGAPIVGGEPTQVCAFFVIDGAINPVTTAGRVPSSPGEIALGTETADRLGVRIGDDLAMSDPEGSPTNLRVVGTVVNPDIGDSPRPASGAVMTVDGFERLYGSIWEQPYAGLVVSIADGLDVEATAAALAEDHPISISAYSFAQPPDQLVQLARMRSSLAALAVFLGALGVVGLIQYQVLSARRRRHDIAILRSLGFVRRQVCESGVAQAVTVVAIGLAVGIPLGLITGRRTWLFAVRDLGIIDTPVTPWRYLLPVAVAFLAGSAVLAWYTSRLSTREHPGAALREE